MGSEFRLASMSMLLAVICTGATMPAEATTLARLSLEQLASAADAVARVRYSVTAWALGAFRIRRNDRTGEETVTQDSSTVAVFDQTSRRFVTEGIRDLPLRELRRRLTVALRPPTANGSKP